MGKFLAIDHVACRQGETSSRYQGIKLGIFAREIDRRGDAGIGQTEGGDHSLPDPWPCAAGRSMISEIRLHGRGIGRPVARGQEYDER